MIDRYELASLQTAASIVLHPGQVLFTPQSETVNAAAFAPEPTQPHGSALMSTASAGQNGEALVSRGREWSNAGVGLLELPEVPRVPGPPVRVELGAQRMLTDLMAQALNELLGFLHLESRRQFVPILSIYIDAFENPEEPDRELVVSLAVPLNATEALGFWDKLGRRLPAVARALPPRLSHVVDEMIAVEVRWQDDRPLRSP